MSDLLAFTLEALAVYRIAALIAIEDGPFDVMSKLRGRVDQSTWIGRGARCVVCVSFWIAMPFAWLLDGSWITWLALAGAVSIVHRALTR